MLRVSVLSSGSKGCCTYVEVDNKCFLIDCGLRYKALKKRMKDINRDPACIGKIFISHRHGDHLSGVDVFKKKHFGVKVLFEGDEDSVVSFDLDHDEPCNGFRVEDNDGNVFVYCSDTGTIPCGSLEYFFDASVILIESNHDYGYLMAGERYSDELKERVSETHMENRQAGDLLEVVASDKLEHVIAFHLSGENNSKDLVEYETGRGLKESKCKADVHVADQNKVLPMITVI